MHDSTVQTSRLCAYGAWVVLALFMVGVWLSLIFGHDELGRAFGFTGCAWSAIAATAQVRCYLLRTIRMIFGAIAESNDTTQRPVRTLHR